MSALEVRLEGRQDVATGTTAFHFSKPPGFSFEAGQAIDLILGDAPTTPVQDARHAFSIVSAPSEPRLTITTRMRDTAFKRALEALAIGSTARLEGPFGSFNCHEDRERPLAFVAGGIGITPFISILRQAEHETSRGPMCLLYSNRRPEEAAFLPELEDMARRNSGFHLLTTMTEMSASTRPWQGETARVNEALIRKAVSNLVAPIYYVAGPPAMVVAVRQMLNAGGVGDEHVRSEEFFGY